MNVQEDNTIVTNNHIKPMLSTDSTAEKETNEIGETTINNGTMCNRNQNLSEVWTKETFTKSHEEATQRKNYLKANLSLDLKPLKTSWASKRIEEINGDDEDEEGVEDVEMKEEVPESNSPLLTPDKETPSPSHHARRPMNAFLIFCKKHRPIVRLKFPHLENRGVTRILGEWWALLEDAEKSSYTSLAKEYKDAFFSANPDFKWYKLPAPPLRTLNTRPVSVPKPTSPLASPTLGPTQITSNSTEFTPGKLADETQLGNLTSLMNSSAITKTLESLHYDTKDSKSSSFVNNNNNINNNNVVNESEQHKQLLTPKETIVEACDPPKPLKKRKLEEYVNGDNNKIVRDIFGVKTNGDSFQAAQLDQNDNSYLEEQTSDSDDNAKSNEEYQDDSENMTQQELMNKVVESMFPQNSPHFVKAKNGLQKSKQKSKETRKSGRSCKGKRYAEFMIEGKLLGSKQTKKVTQYKVDVNNKFDDTLNTKIESMMHNKSETQTPKLDLGDMIKRLAERTNIKLEDICEENREGANAVNNIKLEERRRTESETSEDVLIKSHSNFNLDSRITELPCLSYEMFLQRKKNSKKRKSPRSKSESSVTKTKVTKLSNSDNNFLVGSKKRKNKNSITRLEKPSIRSYSGDFSNDLFALATLAEVAANIEKIN